MTINYRYNLISFYHFQLKWFVSGIILSLEFMIEKIIGSKIMHTAQSLRWYLSFMVPTVQFMFRPTRVMIIPSIWSSSASNLASVKNSGKQLLSLVQERLFWKKKVSKFDFSLINFANVTYHEHVWWRLITDGHVYASISFWV